MVYITVDPVELQDGQELTRYFGTAKQTSETYTYRFTQDNVSIKNMGNADITVTANSSSTTINQNRAALFTNVTTFSVTATQGRQDFMAESWASWTASVSSGGSSSSSSTSSASSSNKFVPVASKAGYDGNLAGPLSTIDANHQTLTYKIRHFANIKCGLIRLVYGNWYGGDADGANDIVIGASIEDSAGVIYPITFNGQKKYTLNPGGTIVSDPVSVFFRQGDVFYTRNYVSVTAGQSYPVTYPMESGTNEGSGQGDLTASGAVSFVSENAFHPISILGIPDSGVSYASSNILFIGDSITFGIGSTGTSNGFAQLAGKTFGRGVSTIGFGGENAWQFVAAPKGKYRLSLSQYTTHAVIFYGANDLGSQTAAQLQANSITIATRLAAMGIKVYICTVLPKTTSTDSFVTIANQTTVQPNQAQRVLFNAWVRTKPAPFTDYIDLADAIETARDSGIWKARYTGDGVHPSDAGHAALSGVVDMNKMFTGTPLSQSAELPLNIVAKSSNSSIGITWSPVNGAASYNIYRNGTKVNGSTITTTYYSDNGLTNGTKYTYQVKCVDSWGGEFTASTSVDATPSVPTSVIYDSFTRSDSTTIIGSTESGNSGVKTWTVLSGTWGISSNQAYAPTAGVAVVDSGLTDCNIEVKMPIVGTNYCRFVFRATDVNNYWMIQPSGTGYQLFKKSAGSFVGGALTGNVIKPLPGDTIKLLLSGNLLRVFINNVEETSLMTSDAFNATATFHGIESTSATVRFDDFRVY